MYNLTLIGLGGIRSITYCFSHPLSLSICFSFFSSSLTIKIPENTHNPFIGVFVYLLDNLESAADIELTTHSLVVLFLMFFAVASSFFNCLITSCKGCIGGINIDIRVVPTTAGNAFFNLDMILFHLNFSIHPSPPLLKLLLFLLPASSIILQTSAYLRFL